MLHLLDKSFFLCSLLCVILSDFVEVFEYINELMWIRFKKIPGGIFRFLSLVVSVLVWLGGRAKRVCIPRRLKFHI